MLAGPPLGGALFTLGRAVPFVFDAVSYVFSFLSLALMRTPFQQEREIDTARLRAQIVEGFRFLWDRPFLRTCAFLYGLGNFTIPGILLVVIVAGQQQGLSSGGIGLLVAAFGACILLGSLAVADLPPHPLGPGDSPARTLGRARNSSLSSSGRTCTCSRPRSWCRESRCR